MADSWQSAWVEVLPDFKEFRSKANSQMSGILSDAGDEAGSVGGKRMNSGIVGSVGKLGGLLIGAFAALGIGRIVGDAISSGVSYALDGTRLASDLSETKAAIGEVFGAAGKDIEAFASTANTSLGQTQQQALSAAQTFGVFAQSAGLAGPDLSKFSTGLVTLSGDLASFYNTEPGEAIEALSAGLRGEAEPLRKFGVLLDDATLRSRAMELGIYDGNGALTSQQRILASQAEIFAQTGVAQGDFARTSDGLANQQRILAASFEDAKTKLGTALLPAMTQLATFANTTLVPMLNSVIDQVGPVLSEALVASIPAITELILALAPLIPDLVKLGVELLPLFIGALIAVAPLLITAAQNSAVMSAGFSGIFDLLSGDTSLVDFGMKILGMSGTIRDAASGIGTFVTGAKNNFNDFTGSVGTSIATAIGFVASLPGRAVAALGDLGKTLFSSGAALMQGFIDGIKGSVRAVGDAVGGVLDFAASFFPHSPAERGPFSGAGWTAISAAGAAIADEFAAGFDGSRNDLDMGSLVSVPGISAGRIASSSYGSGVSDAGGSGFPSQVTLVDASGALLALTDVRIGNADKSSSLTARMGRQN